MPVFVFVNSSGVAAVVSVSVSQRHAGMMTSSTVGRRQTLLAPIKLLPLISDVNTRDTTKQQIGRVAQIVIFIMFSNAFLTILDKSVIFCTFVCPLMISSNTK